MPETGNKEPTRVIDRLLLRLTQRPAAGVRKTNWATLSISLFLSITLWFVVALNKQDYQSAYVVPVKLVNFPAKFQLTQPFPSQLEVVTQGHGIDLLMHSLSGRQDTITIDFALYEKKSQFIARENLDVLSRALPPALKATGALPEVINLEVNLKANRKVAVVPNLDLQMPEGYRLYGQFAVQPESVIVVGPQKMLDTLTGWPTDPLQVAPGGGKWSGPVSLADREPFNVEQNLVKVTFETRAFTEAQALVKLKALNVPAQTELVLFPEFITVKYLVPLDEYDPAAEPEFDATVDFSLLKSGRSQFLYPTVTARNAAHEITLTDPFRVEYMIVHK